MIISSTFPNSVLFKSPQPRGSFSSTTYLCFFISLFNKLADNHKIKVDLGRILNKKFNKAMKIFGKRSFSTSIVKLVENQCNIKMRAKKYPKKLIDKNLKQKGVEIK